MWEKLQKKLLREGRVMFLNIKVYFFINFKLSRNSLLRVFFLHLNARFPMFTSDFSRKIYIYFINKFIEILGQCVRYFDENTAVRDKIS